MSLAFVSWFQCRNKIEYGQCVWVVGSCSCLGEWEPERGHPLLWHEEHCWEVRVLHRDECVFNGGFEYKYIEWDCKVQEDPVWEARPNRVVVLPPQVEAVESTRVVRCSDMWDSPDSAVDLIDFPITYGAASVFPPALRTHQLSLSLSLALLLSLARSRSLSLSAQWLCTPTENPWRLWSWASGCWTADYRRPFWLTVWTKPCGTSSPRKRTT